MSEKGCIKEKLAAHLRRCGWIYIVGIAVLIFLNNMIYSMTRPRVPEENTVRVMAVNQNVDFTRQEKEWLADVQAADESVLLLEFETIPYDSNRYETGMAMPVKLMAGGYDLLIADEVGFGAMVNFGVLAPLEDYLDESDGERIEVTNAETGETFVGALRMDFLGMEDVYVALSVNSENPESTWTAFKTLREMKGEAE